MNSTAKTRRLVESGLMIALSTILSMLKILNLPWGGSITLCSMLPIILLSYRYGVKWGTFSALVYAALQGMLSAVDGTFTMVALGAESGVYSSGIFQCPYWVAVVGILLLDYIIAFTVLGLGGLFRGGANAPASLVKGVIVAGLARYVVHIFSGFIFFGTFASWFFGEVGSFGEMMMSTFNGNLLFFLYSVIYNGAFMIPEIILTSLSAFFLAKFAPAVVKIPSVKSK